ncbi:hypothetical protein EV130_105221 [Rhizobium azibense]|uniref:Uncharacterized protein n=1 Tax=Rhizobium azibense TaxID=1136135 RepID=A0A4R3RZ34_9HYPH|nr:hypothetical protein [Rhizobium azibense]TCU25564.1 hypothetical protein EV130_105221 [Rhizobium azibense]TCU40149.1 hypothetical protein EV129_102287 [Rhizobium azibense]
MGDRSAHNNRPSRIDLAIVALAAGLFAWVVTGGKAGSPVTTGLGTAFAWHFMGFPIIPVKRKDPMFGRLGKRLLTADGQIRKDDGKLM